MLTTITLMLATGSLTVLAVGGDPSPGPIYLKVAAGDLDGDGTADEAILKLRCSDGALADSRYRLTPRDSASGQASGKRTHKPVTFVKEWGPSTPQFRAMQPTYDLKKAEGGRMAADPEGWLPITLGKSDGLCAAAEAAIVKAKSNITNN